jgi:hypothetical protein
MDTKTPELCAVNVALSSKRTQARERKPRKPTQEHASKRTQKNVPARERIAGPERELLHYAACIPSLTRQRETELGAGFCRRLQYGCEMTSPHFRNDPDTPEAWLPSQISIGSDVSSAIFDPAVLGSGQPKRIKTKRPKLFRAMGR